MPYPVLPDNYDLSMKGLENLLKRLRQDSIIKEQLQRRIVEIVEKPCEGEDSHVHCIHTASSSINKR